MVKLVEVQETGWIARDQLETEHEQVFGHGIDSKMRAQTLSLIQGPVQRVCQKCQK